MHALAVQLFGKCSIRRGCEMVYDLRPGKAQDLLCYLLINRGRVHSREVLAAQFWGDSSSSESRKSLRTALWQLRTSLGEPKDGTEVLLVESDSIQVNARAALSLDISDFEQTCVAGQPSSSKESLTADQAACLRRAAELYRADLLEGCYEDWCLHERERLQNMYLLALDRLLSACEQEKDFDRAWSYGAQILRYDPACERTHQRLMRLHYAAGDRTGAARQYERCVIALKDELGVTPSRETMEIYEKICAGGLLGELHLKKPPMSVLEPRKCSLTEVFVRLRGTRRILNSLRAQLEQDIHLIDQALELDQDNK